MRPTLSPWLRHALLQAARDQQRRASSQLAHRQQTHLRADARRHMKYAILVLCNEGVKASALPRASISVLRGRSKQKMRQCVSINSIVLQRLRYRADYWPRSHTLSMRLLSQVHGLQAKHRRSCILPRVVQANRKLDWIGLTLCGDWKSWGPRAVRACARACARRRMCLCVCAHREGARNRETCLHTAVDLAGGEGENPRACTLGENPRVHGTVHVRAEHEPFRTPCRATGRRAARRHRPETVREFPHTVG